MLYKTVDWECGAGNYKVHCPDLVGSGGDWKVGAKLLGLKFTDFLIYMKESFKADVILYKKNNKVSFVGYKWNSLADARKYKNYINKIARDKNFQI